jgi:hypothetical protein
MKKLSDRINGLQTSGKQFREQYREDLKFIKRIFLCLVLFDILIATAFVLRG